MPNLPQWLLINVVQAFKKMEPKLAVTSYMCMRRFIGMMSSAVAFPVID